MAKNKVAPKNKLTVGRLSAIADSLDNLSDKYFKKSLLYKDGDKRAESNSNMAGELNANATLYREQIQKAKKNYYSNKLNQTIPTIKTDATRVVRNSSIPLAPTQFND